MHLGVCMCVCAIVTCAYAICSLVHVCMWVHTCSHTCIWVCPLVLMFMHMHAGYMGLQCTYMHVCTCVWCVGVCDCFCVHACLFACVRLIPKPVCPAVWACEGLGLPRSLVWIVRDLTFLPDTLLSLFQPLGEADTRRKFLMQGHTLGF